MRWVGNIQLPHLGIIGVPLTVAPRTCETSGRRNWRGPYRRSSYGVGALRRAFGRSRSTITTRQFIQPGGVKAYTWARSCT